MGDERLPLRIETWPGAALALAVLSAAAGLMMWATAAGALSGDRSMILVVPTLFFSTSLVLPGVVVAAGALGKGRPPWLRVAPAALLAAAVAALGGFGQPEGVSGYQLMAPFFAIAAAQAAVLATPLERASRRKERIAWFAPLLAAAGTAVLTPIAAGSLAGSIEEGLNRAALFAPFQAAYFAPAFAIGCAWFIGAAADAAAFAAAWRTSASPPPARGPADA